MTDHLELCIAPAANVGLGDLAAVRVSYIEINDRSAHCHIASMDSGVDKFGDSVISLSVNAFVETGIPVRKLRLKFPNGETGFASVSTPRKAIESLLDESYLITDKSSKLLPFAGFFDVDAIDLGQFFDNKGRIPIIVTYHTPQPALWRYFETNQFSITNAIESLKTLMDSLQYCEAAMVWSWAYGLNPAVFSARSSAYFSKLKGVLEANFVKVRFLMNENQLPEW